MIPRYQTVLFVVLLVASIIMGAVLWHLRDRAHQRLLAGEDSAPTHAPEVAPVQPATLMVASDADDSLQTRLLSLPLPPSPAGRAREILGRLLDLYAAPGAAHPVPGGARSIEDVFFLSAQAGSDAQLAVVNLSGAFAAGHPSGIETETLTILSICATLHANLPRVSEVRFLVDGEQKATLAGHADLTRTYLTEDTVASQGASP